VCVREIRGYIDCAFLSLSRRKKLASKRQRLLAGFDADLGMAVSNP